MKTRLHLLFVAAVLLGPLFRLSAQDCGTAGRYTDNIFLPPAVKKTSNIVYGHNTVTRYATNTDSLGKKDLLLDIYEPDGDPATNRPLVILAFGGGYISGDRSEMESIARSFAQKGYVASAIDYRIVTNTGDQLLLGPPPISFTPEARKREIINDVIVKATNDIRAAIRFFKYHAANGNPYKIDPAKIFVGGASAGAISALQAAYIDSEDEITLDSLKIAVQKNGGLEGNTDLPGTPLIGTYTSGGVAGVINIAGGLLDLGVMDANDPPVYSAHGNNDQVIPYHSGGFSIPVLLFGTVRTVNLPVIFYGSEAITLKAQALGLRTNLTTIPGGGHDSPRYDENIGGVLSNSAAFMKAGVCSAGSPLPVKLSLFTVQANRCAALFNWQTAVEESSSHFEIEFSADGAQFAKVASLQSRNASNGAAYRYQLEGAANAGWYRLKMVDRNGSITYSSAQRFSAKCDDLLVKVYPNPAQNRATLAGLRAGMLVDILSADGRLIWSHRAGGNTLDLPVTLFAKGLLLVQVKNEAGRLIGSTRLVRH